MKGKLLESPELIVELDPRTEEVCGSWIPSGGSNMMIAWDINLVQFFHDKLKHIERPVFIDVGASTGSFALLAGALNAKVFAFEARLDIAEILQANVNLNELQLWVDVFPWALTSSDGIAIMSAPLEANQSGLSCLSYEPRRFSGGSKITVEARTLDSLNIEFDRFGGLHAIKIDTEGCEYHVLLGAVRTIQKYKPAILYEYNEVNFSQFDYHPNAIKQLLHKLGYTNITGAGKEDRWATI